MPFSFNPLWKLLIDEEISKETLKKELKIAPAVMAKMGRNENVSMDTLYRICEYFDAQPNEIFEYIPEGKARQKRKRKNAIKTETPR